MHLETSLSKHITCLKTTVLWNPVVELLEWMECHLRNCCLPWFKLYQAHSLGQGSLSQSSSSSCPSPQLTWPCLPCLPGWDVPTEDAHDSIPPNRPALRLKASGKLLTTPRQLLPWWIWFCLSETPVTLPSLTSAKIAKTLMPIEPECFATCLYIFVPSFAWLINR